MAIAAAMVSTACGDDATGAAADGTGTATAGSGTDGPGPGTADGVDSTAGEATEGETAGEPCLRNDECEDGNPCTEDVCSSGVCEVGGAVLSNECRPRIDVDFPPRAATLQDDSPVVTVTGSVRSGAGPIDWLTVNGEEVTVAADGSFSHDVTAQMGGNTLVLRTADIYEAERKRVQSFLWSTGYRQPTGAPAGIAEHGLGVYLSQQTLDDGDRTPPVDDIASLVALAVEGIDIQQFIDPTTPLTNSAGYNVYLTTIDRNSTSAGLEAIDGGLQLTARLEGITGDLVFDCTIPACVLAGGDGTGDMSISYIEVRSDLLLSVDGTQQLTVTSSNTQTSVVGLNISSNNIWTNFLLTIVEPFIIGGVVADIESELTTQVDGLLGPALSQAFNGLAPNTTLAFPNIADPAASIAVDLYTDFDDTDFHDGAAPPNPSPPQGGVIFMRGGGYAQQVVAPWRNLGVPDRADCGAGPGGVVMPREAPLELGMGDDLLNQLLYGAWRGGLLQFELPADLLGGGGFIEDLEIDVSGMLAPTASDCSADGQIRAHVGDLRIQGSLTLGVTPITFTAYSSLVAGLELSPTETGVAVTISEVEQIDTELTIEEDAALEQEPLLEATLQTELVGAVLDAIADGGLGGIDLPTIDLSATLGLPPGTAAVTITTDEVTRSPGVTVIRGHL
ncbi:MAG: hypothetical protein AB1Z98_37635 [Nannocystaceae bacterium]